MSNKHPHHLMFAIVGFVAAAISIGYAVQTQMAPTAQLQQADGTVVHGDHHELSAEDIAEWKKQFQRDVKSRQRDLDNLDRQFKEYPELLPTDQITLINQAIDHLQECTEQVETADEMHDCENKRFLIDEAFSKLWESQEHAHMKVEITRMREEEIPNMQRELERLMENFTTSDGDTSEDYKEMKELLVEMEKKIGNAEQLVGTDNQEARWELEDAYYAQQDFWELLHERQDEQHLHQAAYHFEEKCKDFEREADRFRHEDSQEGRAEDLRHLQEKCEELARQAKDNMLNGDRGEEDFHRAIDELWEEFHRINEESHEHDICHDAEEGLKDAYEGITTDAPNMIAMVRLQNSAVAEKLEELLQKGEVLVSEGREALARGDCEETLNVLHRIHTDLRDEFFKAAKEAGIDPYQFEDKMDHDGEDGYEPHHDEFDFNHHNDRHNEFKPEYDEDDRFERYGSETGLQSEDVQALMQANAELMEQIETLKEQVSNLHQELAGVVEAVQQYNFGPDTAKQAEQFVRDELPNLTKTEAEAKLNRLITAARKEKFDEGIIPFEDADDNDWFTPYAKKAKDAGLVKGTGESNGTELNPAGTTNVAEAVTLLARINGINQFAQPSSTLGQSLPPWAQAAAGTLEQQGISLAAIFEGKQAGDAVTRGEVAQLIAAVFNLPNASLSYAANFADISTANTAQQQAIASVNAAGIMQGEGDGSVFGVQNPLNRAGLVTVLIRGMEQQG